MDRRWAALALAPLALAALTACNMESADDKPGDASARAACTHWRNIAGDVKAGVLTDAELREKLKEVRDSAQVSDYQPVKQAATKLLASITGDAKKKEISKAIDAMIAACAPIGDYMG